MDCSHTTAYEPLTFEAWAHHAIAKQREMIWDGHNASFLNTQLEMDEGVPSLEAFFASVCVILSASAHQEWWELRTERSRNAKAAGPIG
eukprot:4598425-Amphidinium_carterae.1